ncbi:hypothetical protein NKK48_01625 [Mesorhizobium sp. C386A]|uniref:hypothetical protein n=1 Tax=unclassified Mesorhizobium TaxID=325217 RepID=UPI0003CEC808|nr:hypothetical protein [Mesorhizobium sp. LNJC386A00]ESY35779.1 hypothetical protein X748_14310 [Mesorhizobium sp. LNJC386A00]
MIIEHDEKGMIEHIISDPVNEEVRAFYLAQGAVDFPPVKLPPEPAILNGVPVLDEAGQPVMTEKVAYIKCRLTEDYILDGAITPRPVFDVPDEIELIADGIDVKTFAVPDPCEARLDGEPMTITGGRLDLSSDMPAEYTLELIQWPYIEKTVKVTAHAPE